MIFRSAPFETALGAAVATSIFAVLPVTAEADEKASVIWSIAESELTPEERAERESRKACKVAICGGFRAPGSASGDIRCSILKSWRKSQLDKLVQKAKVSWPWGAVRCTTDINLDRASLSKAISDASFDMKLATHRVVCTVDREEKDKAEISFEFEPTVTFRDGKAVQAKLNWGKVEAPTLIKGAMWTATATDNTFNVLQSTLVDDINDFVSRKCDEVKDEWSKPGQ